MDRYGEEIEYDFLAVGLPDPIELFQQRRWRRLHSLILRLPRTSLTREAMANDEELVEEILRQHPVDEKRSRRMTEYSPEVEALCDITDRLGDVVSGLVALGGKKPSRPKATPRPRTAFDTVRDRLDQQRHEKLVARMLPWRAEEINAGDGQRARRATG